MRPERRVARALLCALAVTLLLCGPARATAPCTATPAPGSHPLTLVVDGHNRSALVHVPGAIQPSRRPALVVALHGYGGTGPKMESYSGLSPIADANRFIVAYPSSKGPGWNVRGSRKLPSDVRFLSSLITYLAQTMCVDPGRVYVAGVSDGGFMAALAACRRSSQIAGIAVVAGAYAGRFPCRPAEPVSVLDIHGTADPVVPYFGSQTPTADRLPPFVNGWVRRDRCAPGASVRHIATRTTLYRWQGCASSVTVEHIKIRAGRHQWPGATPPDKGPPATICASCTIWSFFSGLGAGSRSFSQNGGTGLPPGA